KHKKRDMKKRILIICLVLASISVMAGVEEKESSMPYTKVQVYTIQHTYLVNIDIKDTKEDIAFYLYNATGKNITDKMVYKINTAHKKQIDISNLKNGTYFIWYHADDAYRVNRLMKS